jgi:hypothetical protein
MNLFDLCVYKNLNKESGGDVDVSSLVATENKTYNAGKGKAYNPVIVEVPEPTLISKSITANGTYNASDDNADGYSSVSVDVPLPSNAYLLQTIEHESIATFADGTDNFLKSLEVAIEPQQDLHGYDAPWVGGAGKNKFDATESSRVVDGVTFTVNDDGTVVANGTPTVTRSVFTVGMYTITDNTVLMNGCPSDGASNKFELMAFSNNKAASDYGNGASLSTFSVGDTVQILAIVRAGYTANNLVFKPMIRLSTVSDATFAPYSNICPISGHTEANVIISYMVLYNIQFKDGDNPLTVYGGSLDVVNGELKVVPYYASYNGETLEGEWISDRDVYAVGTTPTIGAQVVNIGATPQTYQLTPTIIKSLQGENNFFADSGDVIKLQYWSKEVTS